MSRGTFRQGVIYAAGYLMHAHGEETYAAEILKTAFKDWADVKSSRCDPGDLEKIEPLRGYFKKVRPA